MSSGEKANQERSELYKECMSMLKNNGDKLTILAKTGIEFEAIQNFLMDEGGLIWRDTGLEKVAFKGCPAYFSIDGTELTILPILADSKSLKLLSKSYRTAVAEYLRNRQHITGAAMLKKMADAFNNMKQKQAQEKQAREAANKKLSKLVIKRPNI